MRLMWVALAGLLSATAAEAKSPILVLELEAKGIPKELARLYDRAMREEISTTVAEAALLPKPVLDLDAMKLAAGCADDGPKCLVTIAKTLGATRILQSSMTGSQERVRLSFLLVEASSGKTRPTTAEMSDLDEESVEELRVHVAAAFGLKRAAPDGRISLVVTSPIGRLDGAELLLDDRKVDRAGLGAVTPGQRRLEVRQTGFETIVWIGRVRPGKTTEVNLSFVPSGIAAIEPVLTTPPIDAAPAEPAPPAPPIGSSEPAAGPERGGRVATWILAGGTALAATLGTVFGVQTLGEHSTLDEMRAALSADCVGCTANVCDGSSPHAACDAFSEARLRTNVAWGVAAGLGLASVIAFFVEGDDDDESAVRAGISPTADGAQGSLHLRF